ncbi:MAG: hypothetical protein H6739_07795 [Alphaproteobacteria bacterium]|nr:hypothetical protein [Alphaproteobacteria bacterium]
MSWGVAITSVDQVCGKPEVFRDLVAQVQGISARASNLLSWLAHFADWQTWTAPKNKDDDNPRTAPSAATLASVMKVSDRTVRRAYHDLEHLALLTRERRSWRTNRFVLHLPKLIELAQEGRAWAAEQQGAVVDGWPGPFGKPWPEPETAALPAAPDEEEHPDALEGLSGDLVDRLRAALARADEVLQGRALPPWTGMVPQAYRSDFGRLCVAVRALVAPQEGRSNLVHNAAAMAGKLSAVWRIHGYGPILLMLRDLAIVREAFGARWLGRVRGGNRWAQVIEQSRAIVFSTPEPAVPVNDELLARIEEEERARREARRKEAEARAAEEAAIAEALPAWRKTCQATAKALKDLPPLPDVSALRAVDAQRQEVGRLRRARAALEEALSEFRRLDAILPRPLVEVRAAAQQVEALRDELGVPPPAD